MSARLSEKEKKHMSENQSEIEEKIRSIFAEMDELVFQSHGIRASGATLPITFGFSRNPLAYYSYHPADKSERKKLGSEHFHFSLRYFSEEGDFSLNNRNFRHVVIHEYGHYMVRHVFPQEACLETAHGETWRKCCRELGIVPKATFSEGQGRHDWAQLFLPSGGFERAPLAGAKFACGDYIRHPSLGKGLITEIEASKLAVNLVVRFEQGIKRIDQKWAMKNCIIIADPKGNLYGQYADYLGAKGYGVQKHGFADPTDSKRGRRKKER